MNGVLALTIIFSFYAMALLLPCAQKLMRKQDHALRISSAICSRRQTPAFVNHLAAQQVVEFPDSRNNLANTLGGQLSVGSVLGFATGYSIKRIGQLILVVIGSEVIALQLMARRGWVVVNWGVISREFSPHVERQGVDRVLHTLRFRIPFAGAFTAGVYAGLRWT